MKLDIKEIKNNLSEWIKRPQVWGFFVSVAVLFIISFAFFYPDASQGRVLHQGDMMQGAANGQEIKEYMEETGEKSWWTNSLMSGMPAFQISPSYSSNSLFSWINDVYGLGLPVPSNLLFMMMFGFLILLFSMRVRWYFSLIGAVAFGFSTYFIIIIGAGHIWKFVTLSYIPPTIAGIVLCYRGKYMLGGALAALFAMMQIASNHVQMSYYFMFVIIGLVITYLVMAVKKKKVKQWGIATGALLVAAMLAVGANLPSLYHTYKYSKETIRGTYTELTPTEEEKNEGASEASQGVSRGYMTQYSYGKSETLSLLVPNINGGASSSLGELEDYENYNMTHTEDEDRVVSQILPSYSQYFGGEEGTSGPVYVGAIIFVLFLLGFFIIKKPIALTLFILTSLSVLLALGRNFMWFTDLFADYLPMYDSFRAVESILVIAEFTIPLLAILALQKLLTTDDVWNKHKVAIISVFVTTMLVCLILAIMPDIFGSTIGERDNETTALYVNYMQENGFSETQISSITVKLHNEINTMRCSMVSADAWRSFWFIAGAFGALLLYFYRKVPMWVSCATVGVLVLGDLYSVNKRYVNHESFHDEPMETRFTPQPIDKEIYANAEAMGLGDNYRVANLDNLGSYRECYFHKSVGGYHAAKLTRYNDLLSRGMNINVLSMLNTQFVIQQGQVLNNPDALGNAWFVSGISYVNNADEEMAALSSLDPAVEAVADAKFKEILGSDIPAVSPDDEIVETSYAPNKLTYKAKSANGGIAVFSEIYFPWGWEATIDGRPVEIGRVNYVLRAIKVPAGEHEIVMTFKPKSVETTESIATVSVVIIYLALVAAILFGIVSLRKKEDKEIKK